MANEPQERSEEFVPKGAVAFFAALLVFFSLTWLTFYALLLHRR